MANWLRMRSHLASGFSVSGQAAGRGCIIALGLCIGICCVARGGLVAAAQQTGGPVASIESLIRSEEYDRALQLAKSQLQAKPNDFRLWTLEGIIYSLKGEIARRGIKSHFGVDMPVFTKRRFQHGAIPVDNLRRRMAPPSPDYRRQFLSIYK